MNTIIPNELSFSFDVNDLPARAMQVSTEALSLPGGSCYSNDYGITYAPGPVGGGRYANACRRSCGGRGKLWNGRWSWWEGRVKIICGCCA